eukprot:m.43185 g.43185  ORF g.43185 m.43185 type:complete len:833 (-) comp7096_c0_seq2:2644-5142(-)
MSEDTLAISNVFIGIDTGFENEGETHLTSVFACCGNELSLVEKGSLASMLSLILAVATHEGNPTGTPTFIQFSKIKAAVSCYRYAIKGKPGSKPRKAAVFFILTGNNDTDESLLLNQLARILATFKFYHKSYFVLKQKLLEKYHCVENGVLHSDIVSHQTQQLFKGIFNHVHPFKSQLSWALAPLRKLYFPENHQLTFLLAARIVTSITSNPATPWGMVMFRNSIAFHQMPWSFLSHIALLCAKDVVESRKELEYRESAKQCQLIYSYLRDNNRLSTYYNDETKQKVWDAAKGDHLLDAAIRLGFCEYKGHKEFFNKFITFGLLFNVQRAREFISTPMVSYHFHVAVKAMKPIEYTPTIETRLLSTGRHTRVAVGAYHIRVFIPRYSYEKYIKGSPMRVETDAFPSMNTSFDDIFNSTPNLQQQQHLLTMEEEENMEEEEQENRNLIASTPKGSKKKVRNVQKITPIRLDDINEQDDDYDGNDEEEVEEKEPEDEIHVQNNLGEIITEKKSDNDKDNDKDNGKENDNNDEDDNEDDFKGKNGDDKEDKEEESKEENVGKKKISEGDASIVANLEGEEKVDDPHYEKIKEQNETEEQCSKKSGGVYRIPSGTGDDDDECLDSSVLLLGSVECGLHVHFVGNTMFAFLGDFNEEYSKNVAQSTASTVEDLNNRFVSYLSNPDGDFDSPPSTVSSISSLHQNSQVGRTTSIPSPVPISMEPMPHPTFFLSLQRDEVVHDTLQNTSELHYVGSDSVDYDAFESDIVWLKNDLNADSDFVSEAMLQRGNNITYANRTFNKEYYTRRDTTDNGGEGVVGNDVVEIPSLVKKEFGGVMM